MGRTTIVTGSRGLLGSVVSQFLSEHGHEVLELDRALGHDLTDEAFVTQWFAAHSADALVNLFAYNDHVGEERQGKSTMDVTLASFDEYLKVNIVALFSVCREFARRFTSGMATGGTIVNVASIYGAVSPYPQLYGAAEKHVAYGVSKAGVIQLTRHLATHWAPRVRVNCVVPGGVDNRQGTAFQKAYSERVPLRRMMDRQEICGLMEFLISDRASYCTGGVYPVDGGWTAW